LKAASDGIAQIVRSQEEVLGELDLLRPQE
jgi:hypothetical protein